MTERLTAEGQVDWDALSTLEREEWAARSLRWEFRIAGTIYPIDIGRLTLGQWSQLEQLTGGQVRDRNELFEALGMGSDRPPSPTAVKALLFLTMKATNTNATQDHVDALVDVADQFSVHMPEFEAALEELRNPQLPTVEAETIVGADAEVVSLHGRETDELSGGHSTLESMASSHGNSNA